MSQQIRQRKRCTISYYPLGNLENNTLFTQLLFLKKDIVLFPLFKVLVVTSMKASLFKDGWYISSLRYILNQVVLMTLLDP
jgi:hypothetical protein